MDKNADIVVTIHDQAIPLENGAVFGPITEVGRLLDPTAGDSYEDVARDDGHISAEGEAARKEFTTYVEPGFGGEEGES
jgi:hypothetical protein